MDAAQLEAMTNAALARLDGSVEAERATAKHSLKCPDCGHEDGVSDDPRASIYTCDECKARIAFGVLMPRLIIEPHPEDARFIRVRVLHVVDGQRVEVVAVTIDRPLGGMLARELLSVCP